MSDDLIDQPEGFKKIELRTALEERYLTYALSTIMHRALPDVRDGLKPVHRRLLYTMSELKLDPQNKFKKCARVVGDVMGKFHPHGDQAIYDAMVRLAQDFAVRYPLVDGQGNFGNIDGDNAAAMRYTEAKLTKAAMGLLEGIKEDAVDFHETYDGEDKEPAVLSANFPNLLANGSAGIAVGMATNIPPHNVDELLAASSYLIRHPRASIEKLMSFVPGPDFPTGGIIVESEENIREAYESGRGGFRLRARWSVEELSRGNWQIVVTEIPYQVQKSRLIERIADLMQQRKLPLLGDIRDESAETIRLILEPKSKTIDPAILMEALFKVSELETRISLNMNVLSLGKIPNVLGLRDVLNQWLEHRRDVLIRRSNFRKANIEKRLELLEGYLIAYLNIDRIIQIIREEDKPKPIMMAEFALTDIQAEAILNMRLRALRKLEEMEIKTEHEALTKELEDIVGLLGSQELQDSALQGQIAETRRMFAAEGDLTKRRAEFGTATNIDDLDLDSLMIEKEPVTIVLSSKGWVRTMKGHLDDLGKVSFKDGDELKQAIHAQTTDKLVLFGTNGKFYTLAVDKLPGGRGHGEPLRIMIDLEAHDDILSGFIFIQGRKRIVASKAGNGFVVIEDDVVAMTRKGKQVLNVKTPDEAYLTRICEGDMVGVIGENRKLLVFPLSELNEMSRGKGVRLQKYKDGGLSDVTIFTRHEGLVWRDGAGRNYSSEDLMQWEGARASAGRMPPKGFPKNNKFNLES